MPSGKITVQIAADWVAAVDAGLTPDQKRELEAWLAEDASHRYAFDRMNGQYKAADRLSEFRPASEPTDPDFPALIQSAASRSVSYGNMAEVRTPRMEEEPEPHSLAKWLLLSIPLVAALVLIFLGYTRWYRPNHGSYSQSAITYVGDLRTFRLPDGSIITLNTDSAVDVIYTRHERLIQLTKGEAHFAVARNKDRPFIVGVGNVAVRAFGTAFNIRLKPEQIEVVVTEGLVRVDDIAKGHTLLPPNVILPTANEEPVLAAGECLTVPIPSAAKTSLSLTTSSLPPEPSHLATIPAVELSQRLAWREQRLVFEPTALQDVVAEFNRYTRRQLRVDSAATGQVLVGGTFKVDDLETFLRLLETNFNVMADRKGEVIVLKQRP